MQVLLFGSNITFCIIILGELENRILKWQPPISVKDTYGFRGVLIAPLQIDKLRLPSRIVYLICEDITVDIVIDMFIIFYTIISLQYINRSSLKVCSICVIPFLFL